MARPWQEQLAAASRPLLTRLVALPRIVVPLALVVLLVGGVLLPQPWGALPLLVVAAFLGWLLALAWPRLAPAGRALRLLAVGVVVVAAVLQVG